MLSVVNNINHRESKNVLHHKMAVIAFLLLEVSNWVQHRLVRAHRSRLAWCRNGAELFRKS